MKTFLIKRLLSVIPILFIVSLIIFACIHLTPGDPARAMLGEEASEEQIMNLRESMGLNDPLPVQYVRWLGNACKGDLGESIFMNKPVTQVIGEQIKPTLSLAILAQIFALVIALPIGIIAAKRKGTWVDHAASGFTLFGISIPSFLLGLLLILFFAVWLRVLPVAGYKEMSDGLGEHIKYLILPALSLGLMQAALITRMTRASVLEVLNTDYIKMARSKGVRGLRLLYIHALKNALIAIITVVGQSFITLLSGATVVEFLFNIPGVGQLIVNSIARRDYAVIQGIVLIIAIINIIVNFCIDLFYGLADPRIRIES